MDVSQVARDLADEQQALDEVVAELRSGQWRLATPSVRWSIADQIAHLTYFDNAAAVAITDPEAFQDLAEQLWQLAGAGDDADELTLRDYRSMPPRELLSAWRRGRAALAAAATTLTDDSRVLWYGPSMGSKSFLTARLMEVWAHGQDIVDTVGAVRPPSDRLTHIVRLGFITRNWSYTNRGLEPPSAPVRVELTAPSGKLWELGPENAADSVSGAAVDFCLVVTQRRHLDDTSLTATALAREWLLIAQAFAGPPTDGPAPGTRL
jgi:uncharacterized protein (TIGR03084 family)